MRYLTRYVWSALMDEYGVMLIDMQTRLLKQHEHERQTGGLKQNTSATEFKVNYIEDACWWLYRFSTLIKSANRTPELFLEFSLYRDDGDLRGMFVDMGLRKSDYGQSFLGLEPKKQQSFIRAFQGFVQRKNLKHLSLSLIQPHMFVRALKPCMRFENVPRVNCLDFALALDAELCSIEPDLHGDSTGQARCDFTDRCALLIGSDGDPVHKAVQLSTSQLDDAYELARGFSRQKVQTYDSHFARFGRCQVHLVDVNHMTSIRRSATFMRLLALLTVQIFNSVGFFIKKRYKNIYILKRYIFSALWAVT
eukprot:GHVL01006464.1.p1 GENE.GHVL01006464.1~~GHVL01006464.1.p1  ORF type:complete len:308 (+),score=34.62 GHVL01006464.1:648-1571(+)